MTEDDLAELMAEPPHGTGFGRKRTSGGGWEYLSVDEARRWEEGYTAPKEEEPLRRSKRPPDTIVHGTVSAYKNQKCRCVDCRAANAAYVKRARRNVES